MAINRSCIIFSLLPESRAIATYVLRKYKPELLKEGDLEGSAVVDVWLEVEAHHMEPTRLSIILLEYLGLVYANPNNFYKISKIY
jgi:hypothetical protein